MADDGTTLVTGTDDTSPDPDDSNKGIDLMTPDDQSKSDDDKSDDDKSDDDKSDDDKSDDDKSDEGKSDDGKSDEGKSDEGKGDKKDVDLPVEIKVPEGVLADKETIAEFTALAKEVGLKSEQAQKIFDLQVKLAEKNAERFEEDRKEWVRSIKADDKYGVDNFNKSVELSRQAMARFATPELKALLDATGFGDHPEVFKLMVNVGRAMSEADFLSGGTTLDDNRDTAEILFGDMTKQKS